MSELFTWVSNNWIEICGTLTGLVYLWFSVRQSVLTWPTGILSSLLYVIVFFKARFYAGMGLQCYYFLISIYGWWLWSKSESADSGDKFQIRHTGKKLMFGILLSCFLLFAPIAFILKNFTDSPIPYWDSFTTSMSIVATWMLARKKIEHWLLWILIDSVSIILYIVRGLYPTSLLFVAYTIMAVVGYFEWKKELKKLECHNIILNEL
jgi:nicotinamide mononucleotide transporter